MCPFFSLNTIIPALLLTEINTGIRYLSDITHEQTVIFLPSLRF